MRKLLLSCAALMALCGAAKADLVAGGTTFTGTGSVLTLENIVPGGNQPRNIACIICGDNQPQQPAGFGYNDFSNAGNITTINAFSSGTFRDLLADNTLGTGYSIDANSLFRLALLGRTDFSIGIDVNDTNVAQTLNSFYFLNLTQHTVLASFTGGTTGNVGSINNGTGFPDYTLTGFDLNRGDIAAGDQIIFFARMSGLNDGPDSFFLTQQVAAVPEATTWAMMLLGFAGIGFMALKKSGRGFRFA
jgi:hypothetical protein